MSAKISPPTNSRVCPEFMHPILISFEFPAFIGVISWLEIGLSLAVFALVFVLRQGKPSFSLKGFGLGVAIYLALRGVLWLAGAGYLFRLHSYGMLIAMGFVFGIFLAVRQARREGLDPNLVLDLAFWILIAAMVGSRVLYIMVKADDYIARPLELLKVWKGGLVFYGGFIGAVSAGFVFCRRQRVSFYRLGDVLMPSLALGHFFGRLGCYAAGCCHGSATGMENFGAIVTERATVVARSGLLHIPIHPVQLYEALGELLIFFALLLLRRYRSAQGQLMVGWLLAYPVLRFGTEMFRGDLTRGMYFQLDLFGGPGPEIFSVSQLVSLGMFALGLFLWRTIKKRAREGTEASFPPAIESGSPDTDSSPTVPH